MNENEISYIVRKCIFNVYNNLGPGLLENIYQKILIYELQENGLEIKSELSLPVIYDNKKFDLNFRIDILVEDKVILELKSVKNLEDIHFKQLQTYLKLSNKKLGLLVNFNTANILDNIKRVVNNL
ncbi:GxxExxY protein [Chryseobacterium formosense]|uniref:GxxExxY protein n=1 Tax=Chryseobacterium formosense TaxID=236814 RepID=A0A085Z8R6_9FLAO|nr:GxxExxY protein [Chryseobacterium formosense]KFF00830.1 GxxExxY protein [Chryseobacterium formosense]SFT38393.1 GxxExxY protein [Chryseobacterium formosense]